MDHSNTFGMCVVDRFWNRHLLHHSDSPSKAVDTHDLDVAQPAALQPDGLLGLGKLVSGYRSAPLCLCSSRNIVHDGQRPSREPGESPFRQPRLDDCSEPFRVVPSCIRFGRPGELARTDGHGLEPRSLFSSFRCMELVLVTSSWLPILALGNTLYERRYQWSSMSGNVGPGFMLQHFPILPWLVLPLLSFLFLPKPLQAMQGIADPSAEPRRIDWRVQLLCVALMPLVLGWLATQWGWLPIMHRRYLLAAHLAMFLLACTSLLQIRSWKAQLSFGTLVIAALVIQQGNWRHWQDGEWMGWQRFEGWDEAITELNRRMEPTDAICLAPFLIETRSKPFPCESRQSTTNSLCEALIRLTRNLPAWFYRITSAIGRESFDRKRLTRCGSVLEVVSDRSKTNSGRSKVEIRIGHGNSKKRSSSAASS